VLAELSNDACQFKYSDDRGELTTGQLLVIDCFRILVWHHSPTIEQQRFEGNVNSGIRTDGARESERLSEKQPLGRFSDAAQKWPTADVASDGRLERRRPGDHQQLGDGLQGEQLTPRSTRGPMRLHRQLPRRRLGAGEWRSEIISLPEALETLVYLQRQVCGEHKSWPEFHQRMLREKRVIIGITIESVGPKVRG